MVSLSNHEWNTFARGSVVKNFFTTAAEGKNYETNFYNLDAKTEYEQFEARRRELKEAEVETEYMRLWEEIARHLK